MSNGQLERLDSSTINENSMIIRAVSARSVFGRGIEPIMEALQPHRSFPSTEPVPINDFIMKDEIGPQGIRTLDRATGLALSAVDMLMEDAPVGFQTGNTALILGTSMGSVSSTIRFTQEGLTGTRPYLVNPAKFPNTVMNFAAGQAAIRHRLTGPNATIIAGSITGLSSLRYAARMLRGGQAANVIVGATEELTTERQLIHTAGSQTDAGLGEGSAVLLVGPSATDDSKADATLVRGVVTGFRDKRVPHESQLDYLATEALDLSGTGSLPALLVVSGLNPSVEAVVAFITRQTGDAPDVVDIEPILGNTGAASTAFALTICSEMLRLGQYGPAARGWVMGADPTGYIGIAVLEGTR